MRTFKIAQGDTANDAIISNVIDTVEYRDDYVGGGIDPDGIRHGPYWISSISPSSFDEIGATSATDIFYKWLLNCGTIPPSLTNELEQSVVNAIARSESVYVLKKLDETAINDYGNLHMEFHELIAIDRTSDKVALIVLTDD
ncbi:hypothetical protein ACFWPX_24475 [Nocardia sp. NPDC058518]|uniref:hypothetical protein n=1 Tax=Nocardia sp. NPDC058518 TaxID=3346534 RepID=UPI003661CEA9